MKIIILCCFLGVLWSDSVAGKILVDSVLWNAATHIYQIDTSLKGKIQVTEFMPSVDLQMVEYVKSLLIQLPDNSAVVQDVAIVTGTIPRFLVLTTTRELIVVNIATEQVDFVILVPAQVITPIKTINNQQGKKLFAGVKTLEGYAIWELDLNNVKSQKLHKLTTRSLKDFILLALQQKQELDFFVTYDTEHVWLESYHNIMSELITKVENIEAVIIGPAITVPMFSWYIVNKTITGNYLTSNNFLEHVPLPEKTTVFLQHGELIFFSAKTNKLFSVHSRTGQTRELTILRREETLLNIKTAETDADFLCWEPQQKQHVLLSIRQQQRLYIQHFELSFDKPKALSWRRSM